MSRRDRIAAAVERSGGNPWLAADHVLADLAMADWKDLGSGPVPANTTVTITLTGFALRDLQAAVARTHPEAHILRIAVDTDPQDPDHPEERPIQWARFKLDEGLWSPPVYAYAEVTAPAYDTEEPR